jgi:hypothetical protein
LALPFFPAPSFQGIEEKGLATALLIEDQDPLEDQDAKIKMPDRRDALPLRTRGP